MKNIIPILAIILNTCIITAKAENVVEIRKIDSISYFTLKEKTNPQKIEYEEITDLKQAKQIFKDIITWCNSINDTLPNDSGDMVFKITFRNGETYLFCGQEDGVWWVEADTRKFYAYYPQEDFLILNDDGYRERSFNLTTGEEDVGNPKSFVFSPSQKRRLSSEMNYARYFFIQEKMNEQYQTVVLLTSAFRRDAGFFLTSIYDAFWENDTTLNIIAEEYGKTEKMYYQVFLK